MKYEQTDKKMSMESISMAMTSTEKECKEAKDEYSKFMKKMYANGYSFFDRIPYVEEKGCCKSDVTTLNEYLAANPHLYPWLIRHGFLREVKPEFEPVSLLIETEKEYAYLYHLLNENYHSFRENYFRKGYEIRKDSPPFPPREGMKTL